MYKAMRPDKELKKKLDRFLEKIPSEGREQVQELIANVVKEGGTSENTLIKMANDQLLSNSLRLKVYWLLPRLGVKDAEKIL
ncbi:MAG: hypothetical protein WD426_12740, partial [Anditalea sp.]